ncbi:MAG: efflux RND transporter permease subunit [bacterium]|nr:efflux RND transporter permease subunit [bacterium]
MQLVATSIRKPVSVTVGVLLITLFGLIGFYRIPIQLTPTVDRPRITVETTWRGASPQEVESEIVDEQEDQLKSLDQLIRMTSESKDGVGSVILEFEVGTDIDAALLKVSNKLNQVAEYPAEADRPVISNVDIRANAIAWLVLRPKADNPVNIYHLRDFTEDFIKPRLERVQGVASSNIFGGQDRELRVQIDPHALAARGITIPQLAAVLARENQNISAGDFEEGKRRYVIRTVPEFQTPEDVERVVITYDRGMPVYVKDVADVRLDYSDAAYVVRQNGHPAIAINALRATGSNIIETMRGIRKAVDELNASIVVERGLTLTQVYDATEYIDSAIALVQSNIVVGGGLALVVLLVFLRSLSSTLIVGLAIPISAVGTFLGMSLLGRNLNVISLAGLAFAIGMLVDNAIVVLENIYRHRQLGKSRSQAAYDGTVEVWGAVLASTLTTIAVFLPVVFIQDEAGQLFRDIAIAISVAVALSLVISITVIPSLATRILRISGEGRRRQADSRPAAIVQAATSLVDRVAAFVYWLCGSVLRRLSVVLILTVVSLGGAFLLAPDTEYLPEGNRNLLLGILLPPPGYNLEEYQAIGRAIERDLRPYWEAQPDTPEAAQLNGPLIRNFFFVARGRQVFMGVVARDPEKIKALRPVIQQALGKIPGMIPIVVQASLFQRNLGEGRSIDIEITGPDLAKLVQNGLNIFMASRQHIPGSQVRPIPSLDLGNPEIQIIPDRNRMAELQMTGSDLGYIVRAMIDGVKVSEYQYEGRKIDLILRSAAHFTQRTQDVEHLSLNTVTGQLVTLGSLAHVQLVNGPEQINHIERQRAITIRVTPPADIALQTAMRRIEQDIVAPLRQQGRLGPADRIKLAGTADKLTTTRLALQGNLLLALIITFLLMAALFESFLYPFVIMFSVPLAAIGGFLGLFLVNHLLSPQPLDILTMLGFVILIGVVVNNAILIVHQALNFMRHEGLEARQAIQESVRTRIRPIMMSAITSVCGMLPLVLFSGAGSELYRGLGSVVIGGLSVSTIFTLFVVPTLFSLVLDIRTRLGWFRHTPVISQAENIVVD